MKPGDRVRITARYGEKFPYAAHYVGREATIITCPFVWWSATTGKGHDYIEAHVDGDEEPGLFLAGELEEITHGRA